MGRKLVSVAAGLALIVGVSLGAAGAKPKGDDDHNRGHGRACQNDGARQHNPHCDADNDGTANRHDPSDDRGQPGRKDDVNRACLVGVVSATPPHGQLTADADCPLPRSSPPPCDAPTALIRIEGLVDQTINACGTLTQPPPERPRLGRYTVEVPPQTGSPPSLPGQIVVVVSPTSPALTDVVAVKGSP